MVLKKLSRVEIECRVIPNLKEDGQRKKNQRTSENHNHTGLDSERSKTQFNAAGNDSDYEGEHPENVHPQSEGHVSFKNKN